MAAINHIKLPEDLLDGIKTAAKAEQRSVDDVVADAVQRYLDDRSWTALLDYGARRAGELGIEERDVNQLIAESRAEQRRN